MKREKLNRWVAIVGIIVNVVLLIVVLRLQYISMFPSHNLLTAYQPGDLLSNIIITLLGIYLACCLIENEISIKIYLIIAVVLLAKIAMFFYTTT